MLRKGIHASVVAVVLACLGTSAGADQIRYDVNDLGTLQAGYQSAVFALNDRGQVAGFSYAPGTGPRTFLYSDSKLTPSFQSQVSAISNSGQMVDQGSFSASGIYANADGSQGYIVRGGDLDGQSIIGGTVTHLGTLEPGGTSGARAVNDTGQATGSASLQGKQIPVLFADGKVAAIGLAPGADKGYGVAINNGGQVAGVEWNPDGMHGVHSFLSSAGQTLDLGSLGGAYTYAKGLNDAGQVVGISSTLGDGDHAFLFEHGTMLDLNDLITSGGGLTLRDAVGINASGQIAVDAYDAKGMEHALLLTPHAVPEPGTLALALMTLGVAGFARKRRTCQIS